MRQRLEVSSHTASRDGQDRAIEDQPSGSSPIVVAMHHFDHRFDHLRHRRASGPASRAPSPRAFAARVLLAPEPLDGARSHRQQAPDCRTGPRPGSSSNDQARISPASSAGSNRSDDAARPAITWPVSIWEGSLRWLLCVSPYGRTGGGVPGRGGRVTSRRSSMTVTRAKAVRRRRASPRSSSRGATSSSAVTNSAESAGLVEQPDFHLASRPASMEHTSPAMAWSMSFDFPDRRPSDGSRLGERPVDAHRPGPSKKPSASHPTLFLRPAPATKLPALTSSSMNPVHRRERLELLGVDPSILLYMAFRGTPSPASSASLCSHPPFTASHPERRTRLPRNRHRSPNAARFQPRGRNGRFSGQGSRWHLGSSAMRGPDNACPA